MKKFFKIIMIIMMIAVGVQAYAQSPRRGHGGQPPRQERRHQEPRHKAPRHHAPAPQHRYHRPAPPPPYYHHRYLPPHWWWNPMYYRCYDWGWYYSPYRLYVYGADLRSPSRISVDGWEISRRGSTLIITSDIEERFSLYDTSPLVCQTSFGYLKILRGNARATVMLYDANNILLASYNL